MAIRQRVVEYIKPTYRHGYPTDQFVGFKWHFGHVVAVYITPAMMALGGLADRKILNTKAPAEFRFYTAPAHAKRIQELKDRGLHTAEMEAVTAKWPTHGNIPKATLFYLLR
jgi:hypothetical protein